MMKPLVHQTSLFELLTNGSQLLVMYVIGVGKVQPWLSIWTCTALGMTVSCDVAGRQGAKARLLSYCAICAGVDRKLQTLMLCNDPSLESKNIGAMGGETCSNVL